LNNKIQYKMKNMMNQKTILKTIVVSLVLIITLQACLSVRESDQTTTKKKYTTQQRIDMAFKQDFERTKDITTNSLPRERLLTAINRQTELFNTNAQQRAVPGIAWQERGPNNVAGRIRAVLVDKNDPTNKKVFVGGVGGGIWYTNDITTANPTWVKINDFLDNIAITDIVQNPTTPNTMYASTGEGYFNGGAQRGLGILKSTDGGNTWAFLASTSAFEFVQKMAFDANGKLYAAVRSSTAAESGIMRTDDAGTTWTQVLTNPTSSSNRGCDINVSASGDIYASTGIAENGGIYRSPAGANAGNSGTWVNITPDATGAIATPNNDWQRIELATAPSDNNVVYAVMQGGSNGPANLTNACRSIMKYNASTNTWTVGTVPTIIDQKAAAPYPPFTRDGNGAQGWYDLVVAVDPNNANTLTVSGIDVCKSTDGGTTWNQISVWTVGGNEQAVGFTSAQNVHADHHNFVFVGNSSSNAILSHDGGISYTTNLNVGTNKPTFVSKNNGLNVTQLYATAIHPTAGNNYFLDGTQDNGSHKYTTAGLNFTTEVSGGDGAFCHISPINPMHQITSYTQNNYYISTDGGASFPQAAANNNRGSFINPTDYDGNNLYGGDAAGNFFRWTNPQGNTASGAQVAVANFSGGTITHVTISKQTANRVYFGLDNGSVVRVNDAHTTNTGDIIGTPRSGSVSCVASVAAIEDSMLVSYSNYGGSKIYASANSTAAGATFVDITGNLPDMPVRWVMFDPRSSNMVIAATELGVWSCDDIRATTPQWNITSSGLARTRVDMLKYRSSDRTLLAASHGRGLFSAIIPPNLNPEINFGLGITNAGAEKTTITIGCRNFTDYDVSVIINGAPSANADITLSHTGTATEGIDFDYTTNNVFGTGNSKLISFASGSADSKSFKVRVYDDAIVDPNETAVFSFTVNNNGGNGVVGVTAPTQTFTISDNDVAINTGTASTIANNVGGAADPAVNVFSPFNATQKKGRFQSIYTAAELTAAGLTAGSNISALGLKMKTKQAAAGFIYNGFNVKIAPTSRTSANNQFEPDANFITCYTGNLTPAVGDINITFTNNFIWNGTSNIALQFCWDNGAGATDPNGDDILEGTDLGAGLRGTISVTSVVDAEVGCTLPTASFGTNTSRATIKLTHYKPATLVETNVNAQKIENVQQSTGEYNFYSSSNNLIAGIKNINADLGCVTSSVLNAGNGFTPFLGQAGTNRSNKVWSITATTNASTATYTVTLYMTTAELAALPTSGLKIYKSSASNIASADGGNTISVPTTVATSSDGTWTSFTATFTGFSIFFIGSNNIVLPLVENSFTGIRANNQNLLKWKADNNSTTKFEVERCYDNLNFTKIRTINAQSSTSEHSIVDDAPYIGTAYYRLKIIAANGNITNSNIIGLKAKQNNNIDVYPSPAKNEVLLTIGDASLLNTYATFIDNAGRIVKTVLLSNMQQQVALDNISSGLIYIKFANGKVVKLIKE
jgi:trimeric autotransporter adhesin